MNLMDEYNMIKNLQGKIIIYLRKSREEMYDGIGSSVAKTLERHEEILQTWSLNTLGYKIPDEYIFREVGSGETIEDRPVMEHVLSLLKTDDIAAILVVEPQRLSRGDLIDCGTIIEILEITKTLVFTPQKIFNLENKFDKKMFKDELLRGNEYLEYTKEILARGRELSVKQGKYIGSVPPYGYSKEKLKDTKGNKLVPKEGEAEVIQLIYKLFLEGMGTWKIANHLYDLGIEPPNGRLEWDHNHIGKLLQNPVYYGKLTYGRRKEKKIYVDGEIKKIRPIDKNCTLYDGLHDGLISEEDFLKVQEIIKNTKEDKTPKEKLPQNPLSGLIFCGFCGKSVLRQICNNGAREYLKYQINKQELSELLITHKKNANLSYRQIAKELNVARSTAACWFYKDTSKLCITKNFSKNWPKLKKILKIKTTKFDKAITTWVKPDRIDSMNCPSSHCKNVSSKIYLVEDRLLELIKIRLDNYKYTLDNYEVEYTKKIASNKDSLKKIDKEISKLEGQLKKAKDLVEQEIYSVQEYVERKKELTIEIDKLIEKKNKLSVKEEQTLIHIKKAVPILEKCLEEYYTLNTKERNKLLSDIVDKAFYTKEVRTRHRPESMNNFKLDVHFKI